MFMLKSFNGLEGWKAGRLEGSGRILQNVLTFLGEGWRLEGVDGRWMMYHGRWMCHGRCVMEDGVSIVGLHQYWIVHDGEFCELQYFNAWNAKIQHYFA